MTTRTLFDFRDPVTGDSVALDAEPGRALLRSTVDGAERLLAIVDADVMRGLGRALLEAAGDAPEARR